MGFSGGASGKEYTCQCRRHKRCRFDPWVGKSPWSRKWQLTPVFLPGKSHGQRRLAGYSPWGCKELDTTEGLSAQREGERERRKMRREGVGGGGERGGEGGEEAKTMRNIF